MMLFFLSSAAAQTHSGTRISQLAAESPFRDTEGCRARRAGRRRCPGL